MFVTSSNEKPDREEEEGHQDTVYHETRLRKRSLLQNFVEVLFYDDKDEIDQSPSQTEIQKKEDPQGHARKQMVLELQKLDRDRKKSLLVRVIDGLLSRSDHSQQEEMPAESIEDHVAVNIANDEYTTGENYWRQESLQDNQREDHRENNEDEDSVDREIEIDEEDKPTLFSASCRQRKRGIASVPTERQLGLPNFSFEDEGSEEKQEECSSDTSGQRRQKKSVTFSLSELPVVPSLNEDGGNDFKLDASNGKLPTIPERSQEEDKEIESVEDGCNPSALEEKQEVLDLPAVSSPIHPVRKRRPKTIKHWLRDPNLYKVCEYVNFLPLLNKNGNQLDFPE